MERNAGFCVSFFPGNAREAFISVACEDEVRGFIAEEAAAHLRANILNGLNRAALAKVHQNMFVEEIHVLISACILWRTRVAMLLQETLHILKEGLDRGINRQRYSARSDAIFYAKIFTVKEFSLSARAGVGICTNIATISYQKCMA